MVLDTPDALAVGPLGPGVEGLGDVVLGKFRLQWQNPAFLVWEVSSSEFVRVAAERSHMVVSRLAAPQQHVKYFIYSKTILCIL